MDVKGETTTTELLREKEKIEGFLSKSK